MLNSVKIIPTDQRQCAIPEKIRGGAGPHGPSLDPPLEPVTDLRLLFDYDVFLPHKVKRTHKI